MITLTNLLALPITCESISIMIYKDTYIIKDKEYDTYEYYITLRHTHKRLDNNVKRLIEEYGNCQVKLIEWRSKGDILLKIK